MNKNMILEFQNEYRWLSNFAPVKIVLQGIEYPSVEHAYMSAKSDEVGWKNFCADPNNTAGVIKRKSRDITLKGSWEIEKINVMVECVKQKFSTEPYRTKLIETGDQLIQEGNKWNDTFWGVCLKTNKGYNNLGRIIMSVRLLLHNGT